MIYIRKWSVWCEAEQLCNGWPILDNILVQQYLPYYFVFLIAARYCGQAPDVQNGYVVTSSGTLTFGETVTYKCNDGFTLGGSDTILCTSTGGWENPPTCSSKFLFYLSLSPSLLLSFSFSLPLSLSLNVSLLFAGDFFCLRLFFYFISLLILE